MIVFTFSSTTDSAESLLTMSLKSTYYPKPISGSRLFVEPALVTRYYRSFRRTWFFSSPLLWNVIQRSMTLLKDVAIFIRRHFTKIIEMTITLTGRIGYDRLGRHRRSRRYKQWYIKGRCKYEVYFYFTGAMCQMSDFLLLVGSRGRAKTRSPANSFSICYRRYNVPISPEST